MVSCREQVDETGIDLGLLGPISSLGTDQMLALEELNATESTPRSVKISVDLLRVVESPRCVSQRAMWGQGWAGPAG
jgi:hypothetical protein